MNTQSTVPVSIAEVWISAPDTQTPNIFWVVWVHTANFGFFLLGDTYLPEVPVPVTKIKVSAPALYENPTVSGSLGIGVHMFCVDRFYFIRHAESQNNRRELDDVSSNAKA